MSDDAETDVEMATLTFDVPDDDWLDDQLSMTRYETLDDFVMETLDKVIYTLKRSDEVDPTDEVEIEVPEHVLTTLREEFADSDAYAEESVEELLEQTFVTSYIIHSEGP